MKKRVDIVLVIPAGPDTQKNFLIDTILSFIHYTSVSYQVVVVDDSKQGLGNALREDIPEIDVLVNKRPGGLWAGLYVSLANAFSYVLDKYDFTLIFKIDTDALIIGPEPEKEALAAFSLNPNLGIAGQYGREYSGALWDRGWPKARILNGTRSWKFFRRPMANLVLRKFYLRALANGYQTGESVFGGACFYSRRLLLELKQLNVLPSPLLGKLNLGEDHIFSLLAKASGFGLCDLSDKGQPFALAWKELPASPETLFAEGKKIIHSTRAWLRSNETEIRDFFKQKRRSNSNFMMDTPVIEK